MSETAIRPSIAFSDLVTAVTYAHGAYSMYARNPMAAVGYSYLSIAAVAGVLRFGVSDKKFRPANEVWGNMTAFIGLPLVGHYASKPLFLSMVSFNPGLHRAATVLTEPAACVSGLALFYGLVQAYNGADQEAMEAYRTLTSTALFLLPVFYDGYVRGDTLLMGSVGLFVLGGVIIGPDLEKRILGVRRVDWFHYVLSVAAYGLARSLSQ